jgi:hypothetical protein
MEKKKRGRKPKSNIILNENPVFDKDNSDNLISCIKHPKNIDINEVEINNIDYVENDNNICFLNKQDNSGKNKNCWNCCHCINGDIVSYPVKYINKIFYINGNFCSYECAGRYIFDNFNDIEIWEKYNLLNFYYNINTNNKKNINIPPNKLRLKLFGGDLTREEYINNNSNLSYDGYLPPIIPINNLFYNNENKNITSDNDLKLYRKKKINKKNIKDNLNK